MPVRSLTWPWGQCLPDLSQVLAGHEDSKPENVAVLEPTRLSAQGRLIQVETPNPTQILFSRYPVRPVLDSLG